MTLAQVSIPGRFFANQPGASGIGSSPGRFVSALLPNLMVIAGAVFFFLIIGAGLSLVIGAGSQKSPADAAKGKAALTWAVAGFLLVISAYFILQIVQAVLGVNLLSPPPL